LDPLKPFGGTGAELDVILDGFGREVMVEKQMAGHRVDRAICGWFWDYVLAHAAGDPSKVTPLLIAQFQVSEFSPTFAYCFLGEP